MWILPKQLISVFAVDTEELISDSSEFSQMCEQSLMWKSKPSLAPTWLKRWKANNWMQRLSGQILKPSMQNLFEVKWTFSLVGSHANRSATQGNERVQKTLDTCSRISKELSETVSPQSSSSKTSKGLFPLSTKENQTPVFSNMSWSDWKKWVAEQRRDYSRRKSATYHIGVNEPSSSVFPTMTVSDCKSHDGTTLTDAVQENWATASTMDYIPRKGMRPSRAATNRKTGYLSEQVAVEINSQPDPSNRSTHGSTQEQSVTKKLSQLWVAQLMGLPTALWCIPVEWMHSGSSETE